MQQLKERLEKDLLEVYQLIRRDLDVLEGEEEGHRFETKSLNYVFPELVGVSSSC